MAGTRNKARVQGEISTYMNASRPTIGAYSGGTSTSSGASDRVISTTDPPRTLAVTSVNPISRSSLTSAPTNVAAIKPPNTDGTSASVAWAASPVTTPVRNLELVYAAHLSLGARSRSRRATSSGSPSIDALPTTPPARGPSKTAANSVGSPAIVSSVDFVRRTLFRSATAAAAASTRTVTGSSTSYPASMR